MGCGASSGANVVDTVGGPEADAEVKAKTEEEARKKAAEEAEEARIKAEAETKAKADAEVKEEADRKKAAADATAPITDAADAGAAHGAVGIDHVWQRRLQRAMDETAPPGSFEDAIRPLTQHFPEIDFEDLRAVAQGLREAWRERLYSESGGFNLPETYHVDWAIAIRVYTMSDPPVYRIVNREMFNPKRRKPGGNHSISDGLSACMPFIRLLKDALENLPESYVFRGQVRRGVKWSFPSPDDHDPVGYFVVGQRVMWYEFKSTSTKQEVMTREHFCGVTAGPRTIFIIDVLLAFAIKKFSFFQGVENEHEVLLLPLSEFVVVHAARNIIDPHETVSVQRSGFPDTVHLRQVEPVEGRTQEEADTALAREIQQQLDLEHAVEMESKKRKDAEAQQKAEAEARQRVEAEAQQRAKEAEAQLKVEENARQKAAEEQARIQAEQDAKVQADAEAKEEADRKKAAADATAKAEEDARKKAAAEAEMMARIKAETEAKVQAGVEAKEEADRKKAAADAADEDIELAEIVLRKLDDAGLVLSEDESLEVLISCIQYGQAKARRGEGKDLLMVIGNTGAGKSTLINFIHGCDMERVKVDHKKVVRVRHESAVEEMMKIGHDNRSMTFVPDLNADETFTYLDCPGFLDNRGPEINIANAVNIRSVVCKASTVRVLVLINYNSLEADRGRGVRETLKILIGLFGTIVALKKACSSILLGVSKVPKFDTDGEEMTLDDVRVLFKDKTALDEDSVLVLQTLSQRMFIYDPLDGGSESWIKRQDLIKLIQDLPPLREPRYAFHTVLTAEDFEVLRAITRNLHDQILEQMNKDEFERVGISLGSLEKIEEVDNAFVTRLVMEVRDQLSRPLRALEDEAFQHASYENFEEAAGTLIRLQTAAQHLPGRLGDDAAQRHARALAWVEKRKKEVEDMRVLMEANKDANKRAQQLEVQMQMLMKQSEADKENIQRLTDTFREQELKWEQDREQAKTAFEQQLRQYQDQMRSANEEEKQALEAQMQQLQQERSMSEKLYEKQRLEEKQRNEKLVADLQQKNAETERKVKEAEEAAAAERQKQLEAAERVRAEEARRKEEEAAKAKAAAEAKHIDAPTQQEADAFRAALPGLCSPTGDLAALLADMERLRTQPQAQATALDALADLMAGASDTVRANGKKASDNRGAIFELGGLEAGSAAMQAHASERAVQRAACKMFDEMASTSPHAAAICVKARELGVIEGVLAALAAFDSDRALVKTALGALDRLMSGSDDNRTRVVAGGGVEGMLAVLAAFESDRELVGAALSALRTMMIGSADNSDRVVAAGGVEGVLKALETFSDDNTPYGVVYQAVAALNQVSTGGPAALARLRALGAAGHVRAAMAVPGVHERAQEYGQKILARLGC